MSSSQSKAEREAYLKAAYGNTLKKVVIPMLMMPEDITAAVDIVLGIDRRKIMVQVLRELTLTLEESINATEARDNDNPSTVETEGG